MTPAAAFAGAPPAAGTPSAFGTAPAVGPEVSVGTFLEAEKLVQVTLKSAELGEAAGNWRSAMAPLYERRVGPRTVALEPTLAPATEWHPVLPEEVSPGQAGPGRDVFVRSKVDAGPLPSNDADIAFASITELSQWIEDEEDHVTEADADLS